MPCRAAVSAVAHPATPEPRINSRSCGAPAAVAEEEELLRRPPPEVVVMDPKHLTSPTQELHRMPDLDGFYL